MNERNSHAQPELLGLLLVEGVLRSLPLHVQHGRWGLQPARKRLLSHAELYWEPKVSIMGTLRQDIAHSLP